jgi:hypothetical protein
MEDLYALYLKLYAFDASENAESFAELLDRMVGGVSGDTTKGVEFLAVAAIATTSFDGKDVPGRQPYEQVALLDFYEFQQVWQRYRNLAPRQ